MESMKHNENYIPVVDGKILTMPQGGPIQYGSKLQAEVHARRYKNGYTGGAYLRDAEDVL
jgi:hypothetical protein